MPQRASSNAGRRAKARTTTRRSESRGRKPAGSQSTARAEANETTRASRSKKSAGSQMRASERDRARKR